MGRGANIPGWRIALGLIPLLAGGDRAQAQAAAATPSRPAIAFNRWQEDWSALADPRTPRQALDGLKYIPLDSRDAQTYLSFGADARQRYEANDAPGFGVGSKPAADYVISRVELDADLRIHKTVQVFVQLQDDRQDGKTMPSPVDADRLDLEQGFVAVTRSAGGGVLKLRLGRQQFAFDLQRFVAVRDGPNVRQSFDAAWADYERGPWRFIGFYSRPVQTRDGRAFDDYSSGRLTYGGLRAERQLFGTGSVAVYYSRFTQADAAFLSVRGHDRRDNIDVHIAGVAGGWDWDAEAMEQSGRIASQAVQAWAVGSLGGYSFQTLRWSPRLGLQIDAASGDRDAGDRKLDTFNPLFPNGAYVTLAGYTGYSNFVHVKPSLTVHPSPGLKLMLAAAAQWRQTTADAVYSQPDVAVAATAGRPGAYTGAYGQARADWQASPHLGFAVEAVHFAIGDALRRAGGHDADYLGLEAREAW